MTQPSNPFLDVKKLKMYFPISGGFFRRKIGDVKAVDGVDFYIDEGETLGLVGESGCGKTTIGRTIIRLYDPTSGDILINDPNLGVVSIPSLKPKELLRVRQNMQFIFQDPFSSLDPRMTVGDVIAEPIRINLKRMKESLVKDRVAELLERVGMSPDFMTRYPHAFSGGQRQRIGIARALALNPKFIICDEPVSALDVSIQAQVLNLLQLLQKDLNLTYLFIAHDLSVVEHISNRVAVMYVGHLVEMADTRRIFFQPRHPYTEALLSSIPKPDPMLRGNPKKLPGDVPSPANPPPGCKFHPRCQYAQEICRRESPELRNLGNDHWVACHLTDELNLQGWVVQHDIEYAYPSNVPAQFKK
jgi:peptide/nickel transport system ATP-binding protein